VRIGEIGGWELAQLAVFAGQESAMAAAIAPVLGAEALAARAGHVQRRGGISLYRTAPDAYWVLAPEPAVISQLLATVPASTGTVTPLGHSRVRLLVDGPAARTILSAGISVDLHPRSFAVGAFVQTALHHTGVLLERCAQERYELYVPRTFALSIWQWLLDAALPAGYEITAAPAPSQ
jgi:sarcosine oxidase subunit gamma